MLVRFRDLNDPKTVEQVDPLDLTKTFGPSVRLVGATLEIASAGIWPLNWIGITGAPLTTGIEQKLKWLRPLKGGHLDGAFAGGGPALANILYGGDLKRDF